MRILLALLLAALAPLPCAAQDHHGHGGEFGVPSSLPEGRVTSAALYVVNGGSHTIVAIDAARLEPAATFRLRDADYPYRIALVAGGSRLLVGVPGVDLLEGHSGFGGAGGSVPGALLLLEAKTGHTVIGRRLEEMCHNAVSTADGKEIWTAQMTSKGALAVLNPEKLEPIRTVPAGSFPVEVALSAGDRYVLSTNWGSNDVSIVERASGKSLGTVPVATGPTSARLGGDGLVWVACPAGRSVAAIAPSTATTARRLALDFQPAVVDLAPDGRLWVTDPEAGRAVVLDAATGRIVMAVATGAGAHGLAFWPAGKLAFVSNQRAGTVTALRFDTGAIVKSIATGKGPAGLAFRP